MDAARLVAPPKNSLGYSFSPGDGDFSEHELNDSDRVHGLILARLYLPRALSGATQIG
jgi:hypothetical protein